MYLALLLVPQSICYASASSSFQHQPCQNQQLDRAFVQPTLVLVFAPSFSARPVSHRLTFGQRPGNSLSSRRYIRLSPFLQTVRVSGRPLPSPPPWSTSRVSKNQGAGRAPLLSAPMRWPCRRGSSGLFV